MLTLSNGEQRRAGYAGLGPVDKKVVADGFGDAVAPLLRRIEQLEADLKQRKQQTRVRRVRSLKLKPTRKKSRADRQRALLSKKRR